MPELPDVEGFKRVLAKNALGKTIDDVIVADARMPGVGWVPRGKQELGGTELISRHDRIGNGCSSPDC